jgi:hypothetical protein
MPRGATSRRGWPTASAQRAVLHDRLAVGGDPAAAAHIADQVRRGSLTAIRAERLIGALSISATEGIGWYAAHGHTAPLR